MIRKKGANNNDYGNIVILTIIFVLIIIFVLNNKYIWGSTLDWMSQHSVIPEYFRTLFYDTHNLFPNFAFNLGAGQNIYNYAYYGLLNPVIIFSYLLPFVKMDTYIMVSTLVLVYSSVLLFYYLLRRNNFNEKVSFLCTLSFMLASPLLFHSHRHIMFINYMPFLILALIGVDNYFRNGQKWLICLMTLMIILCSFYYSIPSILCIVIYGVYKYISLNKKIKFKSFMKDGIKFIIPIFIGIMMSSILLFPVFGSLLVGRMKSVVNLSFLQLLMPSPNISYLTYNSYGIGLTSISIFALISLFFDKKRENRFLFIVLSLIIVFPLFNSMLNAFMYVDAKILIPMLPLYSYVIAIFIDKLFKHKLDTRKLFIYGISVLIAAFIFKTYGIIYVLIEGLITLIVILITNEKKTDGLFYIYIVALLIAFSLITNTRDHLEDRNNPIFDKYENIEELLLEITNKDPNKYRTTVYVENAITSNNIYKNIKVNNNYLYSSIYNVNYNKFFYDVFNNPMQSRNRIQTTANTNVMFLMFMSNKYFLSENDNLLGYNKINAKNGITSYINDDVLPYMYVSSNTFNKNDFDKLSFPYNNEVLLNNVVVDSGSSSSYESKIHEFHVIDVIYNNIKVTNNNGTYNFYANKNSNIKMTLPSSATNKIVMIKFKMNLSQSCEEGDQAISINGQVNKLTCAEWKYYNGNEEFTYTLSNKNMTELNIDFYEGLYSISDIKLYYLDYNDIKDIKSLVTEVNISSYKTNGDNIYGTVNVNEDGYLVTSIPYQEGFKILVDGKNQNYENVNKGFIGFRIYKGEHTIIFTYTSPYKRVGIITAFLGLILFCSLMINDKRKKRLFMIN